MRPLRFEKTYDEGAARLSDTVANLAQGVPWALQHMDAARMASETEEIMGLDLRMYTALGGRVQAIFRLEGSAVVMIGIRERGAPST